MKNKLSIKTVMILIIISFIYPAVSSAQYTKPAKQTTPVINRRTNLPKIDTSKLKPGQAPVTPKQNKPINMQVKHNNIFRVQPLKLPSAPYHQVKGGYKAHAPAYQQVKDSTHGFGMVHPGVIFPTSSKTGKGTHISINPQPLPPGSRTHIRNNAAQRMINPQPLPPGSRMPVHNKASQRMINPQPLPPGSRMPVSNKAAQRMITHSHCHRDQENLLVTKHQGE